MWETWREEMRHWGQSRWRQWYADHDQQQAAEHEQARQEAAQRRQRIDQERQRQGISEDDSQQLHELRRQDRLQHPETYQLRQEWDNRKAALQQQALTYPVLQLRHHADLRQSDSVQQQQLLTVGFGSAGDAVALWADTAQDATRITRYDPSGLLTATTPLATVPWPRQVQPLPHGQVLVVGSSVGNAYNAAIHDHTGQLVRTANVGKSVDHVLSAEDGEVWAGYDGAVASEGEYRLHGLVRFSVDLAPRWLYPLRAELPWFPVCHALNVSGQKVWMYCSSRALTFCHLISVEGAQAHNHGRLPVSLARAVLTDGDRAAVIDGYDAGDDVITPLQLTPDGLRLAGPPARLVMPDGTDLPHVRYSSRGSELHAVIGDAWYRLGLESIAAS